MNMKDNSSPAFPCGRDVTLDQWEPSSGMTLRDYFAAKALNWVLEDTPGGQEFYKRAAQGAYRIADAMLEARK